MENVLRRQIGSVGAAWVLAAGACHAAPAASGAAPAPDGGADNRIRVQLVAYQQTILSSELSAKIAALPFREGDSFKAGQTLVAFDCGLFHAQSNKAEAAADAARQTLKVDQRLAQLDSIGALDVDLAAAKVRETEAEAGAMRATVSKCVLVAPFAGRVARLEAHAFEYVAPGKPLLEILDTRRLELQMIVPSRWLAWLKVGSRFSVRVDELERDYTGHVVRVGARIDPVSQSVALAGEVDGAHPELLPGMSGAASFKVER